ncbi:S-layer protein [Halanaeroarchaeum sp. HSR-CO]|uniref:COG1361 S-layer family protein n=1 Tax=Halanaeroarchaeum sp. HSR-CO TaxID=2866382 RepID=UPI00217CF739|nr:COG1361 S-layer family protein [Halanaeroarchaeum sp. HSR-CO]UWG47732.1 S-layer protein [Halanaeroarchaeum sp. HSR-CO]
MNGRALPWFVAALVVLSMVPTPVAAIDDPRFVTTVSEPRLTPGAEQVLTVHLENDAEDVDDQVETATNVRVEPAAGETPFDVRSGPEKLGSMGDGETRAAAVRLAVPTDTPAGEYRIPLAVTYEFDGDERETTTVFADVRVPERPQFEINSVTSSVRIGERGPVRVTMSNNGTTVADDSRVVFESTNSALTVEGASTGIQHVGEWPPGENRTLEFDVGLTEDATQREYALTISPIYDDENGIETTAPSRSIGVTPEPRQTFSYDDVRTTGYGDTITVHASLTNTGGQTVYSVLSSVSTASETVRLTDATATAGTLEPGESTDVTFELETGPDTAAEERQFVSTIEYERDDDRSYESQPVTFTADIPAATDVLEFEPVNNTFGVDESNQFAVRVTNTGDVPLTDVHARLEIRPPYESATRTSYVATLDPGESAMLYFEVTTPEDAVETTDALPLTVNASGPDDRSVSTGPTLVEIQITTPDSPAGSTTNLVIAAFVVVLVLVAGWWWLNQ